MPSSGMSWRRLAHLHKSSSSSSTVTAITMSSLLYPDSLAPPTSARGVSNPTTTKVTMPATTTRTTAVPVSRLDVQITPRPNAEVFRRCRPAIYVDLCSMGQSVSPIMCLRHRVGRPRITSNWASVWVVGSAATVANSLWVAHVFIDVEVMQDTGRHVPNLFNTLKNQSYIRRIPDTSYFMPDAGQTRLTV